MSGQLLGTCEVAIKRSQRVACARESYRANCCKMACTGESMAKRLIVRDLPRGMLTATAIEGLEGSNEKGNVKVGDRASLSITKCYVLGPIAFCRRRFDSEPL